MRKSTSLPSKDEVYISYSWTTKKGNETLPEDIISEIQKISKKDFSLVIDKKDVRYKGSIKQFEERLGKSQKIILIINDKFLKSKHCMYEILKIKENGNVYERIFPIILPDAKIYHSSDAIEYIKYWENEEDKINKKLKSLKTQAHTIGIRNDLDNFSKFRQIFDEFRELLATMNTLSVDNHKNSNFKELINSLGKNAIKKSNFTKGIFSRISSTSRLFEKSISIVKNEINKENIKAEEILNRLIYFSDQCKNQKFQIAVLAMVKSGKSTFLNSLLGNEFLPMSNIPETSVPIKINHSSASEGLLICNNEKKEGVKEINSFIRNINREKREIGFKEESEFALFAPFKTLEEKQMGQIKFEIIDAPGFGEALNENLIGKTINESNDDLIDKISAVIYLLDYSKLNTKEEKEVLEKLTSLRGDILDKIQDRLFFIINQIDKEDRNSLPPEKAIDYTFNLIKKRIPTLAKERISTLSARNALLSRMILNENASPEATQDFAKIAFGYNAMQVSLDLYHDAAKGILLQSNILEIEEKIINYLYNNRNRIFIEGLLDNLKRILVEFRNKFIVTAEGALNQTVQQIDQLEDKISIAKKKQESILDEAEKYEKEMKIWIEDEFTGFERKIIDNIESAFSFEKDKAKKNWFNQMTSDWVVNIQREIKKAESKTNKTSVEGLERTIKQINQKINLELSNSFTSFKRELEKKLIQKQETLLAKLKQTINDLARDFEATLKKSLSINLEVIELNLDSIDFAKRISEADSFIDRFVKSKHKVETITKTREVFNPGSWCSLGRYETEVYWEDEIVLENHISKESLEVFWKKTIDERNENAKKVSTHLIESNIKMQIKNARSTFNSYVDDYLNTIQEEKIRLTSGSKEQIKHRLENLHNLNANISSIINEIL